MDDELFMGVDELTTGEVSTSASGGLADLAQKQSQK